MAEVIFEEPPHEGDHPPTAAAAQEESTKSVSPLPNQHHRASSNSTAHSAHITSPQLKPRRPSIDRDAQEMVIDSLRLQIQDLISQVSQLNTKLVKSYDRVSDLEDDLHVASSTIRSSSLKISQLELERTQHLSALNTGLLVEKQHVTAELNRLMEKATEEAAQRGQAESARIAIEKDLDDLSASLFGQANTMVAEARFAKHLSERKVEDAERALKSAEEAVKVMQSQMQTMQAEREEAEKKAREMEVAMGKGKWAQRVEAHSAAISLRLLGIHTPYLDYLAFIAHLRVLHPTSPHATPAMSTLLQLPFLVRLMTEDSEPTVRLDLAPSLNWLSRRSVLSAIHSGQLTIEPISASSLFIESSTYLSTSTTIAGLNSSGDNISCALCGAPIFPTATSDSSGHQHPSSSRPLAHPLSQGSLNSMTSSSWSGATAFFKKAGYPNGVPSSPTRSTSRRTSLGQHLTSNSNTQIFIFRLASPPTSTIASLPIPSLTKSSSQSQYYSSSNGIPSSTPSSSTSASTSHLSSASPNFLNTTTNTPPTTIYPLCQSGWCLTRLRTTCTLWAFVRTGIVDKVWEEEIPPPPPPPSHPSSHAQGQIPPEHLPPSSLTSGEKPPVPPRKRGLWGIASAIGERAASWSGGPGEGDKEKSSKKGQSQSQSQMPAQTETKVLPPPPHHPSLAQEPRRVPPQLLPSHAPPPLPRRNEGRSRTPVNHSPPEADTATSNLHPNTPNPPPPNHPSLPPRSHARTPSSVPLPDSRPATPGSAPGGGPPSRATSPTITIPTTNANAGAAPPPPIPRRAAARARGAPAPGGSRPGTPVNASGSANATGEKSPVAEGGEVKKDEEKVKSEEKAAAAPAPASAVVEEGEKKEERTASSEVPANTETEPKTETEAPPERSIQASPGGEDVFVDAPTPGPGLGQEVAAPPAEQATQDLANEDKTEENAKEQDNEGDKEKEAIVESPVTEHADGEKDSHKSPIVNGESHHDEADGEYVHVGSVNGAEKAKETEIDDSKEKEEKERKEKEQKEREEKERERAVGFVGDATWEERTWKELVRLREDMFWARVGGLRE